MRKSNWFWGIFFLLSAIFVIASQTGSFGEISLLSIIATVLLVSLLFSSIFSKNFFGVFVPLAFIYMIYQKPLGLVEISSWILILASILTSIGFSILFKPHPKYYHNNYKYKYIPDYKYDKKNFNHSVENIDDNNPYAKISFGATSKYLHTDNLESGQFIVSFGAMEIYFDQAKISPNGAEIFLDCSFGAITLYIPKHWRVIDNLHTNLGGVENKANQNEYNENSPTLTLTGNVSLGGIEIKYI